MLLVTEGCGRIYQLGYSPKTKEYVFFHEGVEVWREKGGRELLEYFNDARNSYTFIKEEELEKCPQHDIWNRYCETIDKLESVDECF